MKKIIIITFTFLISGLFLNAQEVVSSGGETQSASGYEVSWTVGEIVIETVTDGTNILTQGFHQSKLIITAVTELLFSGIDVKVFPNPTQDFVVIQFTELSKNPSFSLFDLSGKKLNSKLITATKTQLDLQSYASGSYILKLNHNGQEPLQTFKIIKR